MSPGLRDGLSCRAYSSQSAGRVRQFGGQGTAMSLGFTMAAQIAVQSDEVLSRRDPHLTGGSHLQHAQQARLGVDGVAAFAQ